MAERYNLQKSSVRQTNTRLTGYINRRTDDVRQNKMDDESEKQVASNTFQNTK